MEKKSGKLFWILTFAGMGLILAVVIAFNVVTGVLFDFITIALQGANVEATEFKQANELCQEIAGEGVVLLKNENSALPLEVKENEKTKVNVFGWGSSDGGFLIGGSGSGASNIDKDKKRTLLQGLEDEGFECNPDLIKFYKDYRAQRANTNSLSGREDFFTIYEPERSMYSEDFLKSTQDFSDTAIVVISRLGGEGQDLPRRQTVGSSGSNSTFDNNRTYLELSANEEALIDMVSSASFEKVIVVLNTCNTFECGFIDKDGVDAAISVGAVGQSGAVAVAQILNGKRTPSGRTVDIYPYALESDPAFVNSGREQNKFRDEGSYYVDYVEGIYVGYRYYETAAETEFINYDEVVQYPFGYGLSYTEFDWQVMSVTPGNNATLAADDKITINIRVTNTGDCAGQDVVQVYFSAPYYDGQVEKASVELAAFAKTSKLEIGAAETLSVTFDVRDMASYDCYDKNGNDVAGYELDGGDYTVSLRKNSHDIAECAGAETAYKVPADGFYYEKDDVSLQKVENRFTGATATDGGISVDGVTGNAGIKYMSRENFDETFPKAKEAARARGYQIANGWLPAGKNTTKEYTFGGNGKLSITKQAKDEDGNTVTVPDDDLVFALGKDYDAPEWDQLLEQVTLDEMSKLIRDAGYQTEAVPSIGKLRHHDLDGPAGFNTSNQTLFQSDSSFTCYPVETVLAQSWNAKLSYSYGLGLGVEAEKGVSGIYAPGVNIHRNAFSGRNFEYYSEDPYLSGVMGAETVKGAMANGLYCYVKHFAVNDCETNREGLRTFLTEQSMREIYLKPFELCVKDGKANAIMSSFNYVGATWAGASYALLTEVLREEWGFRGSVVTDWAPNGLRGYMNINQGIRAGNDCWLAGEHGIGSNNISYVNDDSENGTTARACMREATKNILYTYCNTYYEHKHHDSSEDRFVANVTSKGAREQFPYWYFIVVGVNVLTVGGFTFWIIMLVRKRRREKKAESA